MRDSPQISVHALDGCKGYQTMNLNGMVKGKVLQILTDYGCTHNFLNAKLAGRLGCQLVKITTVKVFTATGSGLECKAMCKGFKWTMQGMDFVTDVLI